MDIQRERELCISYLREKFPLSCLDLDLDHVDILSHFNTEWEVWQAAKAQAIPEGFVLMPKEPSSKLVNHGHQVFLGHFNEGGQTGGRSLYFAYKAMVDAGHEISDKTTTKQSNQY